jgi:hypothetical protein
MVSREAFRDALTRIELRFDRKLKGAALEEYYDFLKLKLTDEQIHIASKTLFAESTRYPRPVDFLEAAPPAESQHYTEEDRNPFIPVKLYIKESSRAHQEWIRTCNERDRAGVVVPTESRDGYPAPVVVVLPAEEWEAQMSRQRMGVI